MFVSLLQTLDIQQTFTKAVVKLLMNCFSPSRKKYKELYRVLKCREGEVLWGHSIRSDLMNFDLRDVNQVWRRNGESLKNLLVEMLYHRDIWESSDCRRTSWCSWVPLPSQTEEEQSPVEQSESYWHSCDVRCCYVHPRLCDVEVGGAGGDGMLIISAVLGYKRRWGSAVVLQRTLKIRTQTSAPHQDLSPSGCDSSSRWVHLHLTRVFRPELQTRTTDQDHRPGQAQRMVTVTFISTFYRYKLNCF